MQAFFAEKNSIRAAGIAAAPPHRFWFRSPVYGMTRVLKQFPFAPPTMLGGTVSFFPPSIPGLTDLWKR